MSMCVCASMCGCARAHVCACVCMRGHVGVLVCTQNILCCTHCVTLQEQVVVVSHNVPTPTQLCIHCLSIITNKKAAKWDASGFVHVCVCAQCLYLCVRVRVRVIVCSVCVHACEHECYSLALKTLH